MMGDAHWAPEKAMKHSDFSIGCEFCDGYRSLALH